MSQQKDNPQPVRPTTAVLTRGFDPSLSVGSARPAVFRSSTYVFSSPEAAERAFNIMGGREQAQPGERVDLSYSRFNHPNAEILEDQIVPLEMGAQSALVFNSGMAAITTALLAFLKPGDAIVHTVPLYGGTQYFVRDFLTPFGIHSVAVPPGDDAAMQRAIEQTPNLRVLYLETPANPTLTMTDIAAATDMAKQRPEKPLVMVDNTFFGPVFQHPLMLGADICLYSATKYLSGFSDIVAGVVIAADPELMVPVRGKRSLLGNILQPDECWILNGRLPTVALRMKHSSENAQRIAESLSGHRKIRQVYYPTLLPNARQRQIFERQCEYPGGLFSLDLHGGKQAAFDFLRHLNIAHNAVSLGGVETLICHPKTTTHSGLTPVEMDEAGITDGLVRVSVGIEDWRDLLADFEQALDRV